MNVYRKLCTEFYDLDKPTAPSEALAFYRECAQAADGPILQPMCGSGRFLIPLAQEGFDIDGSDASPTMLDTCRLRAQDAGLPPDLDEQLLDQLRPRRAYKLVFVPAGSFCLISTPQAIRQSLRNLYDALLPGGKIVLEIERLMSTEDASWGWGGRWIERPEGGKIVLSWLGRYDSATRTTHNLNRYELVHDGRLVETEFEETTLRLYTPSEFAELLKETGFRDLWISRAFDRGPLQDADEIFLAEAKK